MARPKKPRYFNEVELPPNLYVDVRKREDYWRYQKPNGSFKTFQATLEDAVRLATEANLIRHGHLDLIPKKPPNRTSFAFLVGNYIEWRESYDPSLTTKQSWRNRKGLLTGFAQDFEFTPATKITLQSLWPWWEQLSYHQQHARRAEFNKFFNWMASNGYTPQMVSNPFTSTDDKPRLIERGKPTPKRERLNIEQFWSIYDAAGEQALEGLQIAMGISLITTMRIGDICSLTFSRHVTRASLRKTINKSEAQRGSINAAHLEWRFEQHPMLDNLIMRARILAEKNLKCPYVISHMPSQRRTGVTKDHICQLTPDRLTKQFAQVRDSLGLFIRTNEHTPPTFHEIRALASDRFRAAGCSTKEVQQIMAHTDERVTKGYQAGHSIEWTPIEISLDEKVLGGRL